MSPNKANEDTLGLPNTNSNIYHHYIYNAACSGYNNKAGASTDESEIPRQSTCFVQTDTPCDSLGTENLFYQHFFYSCYYQVTI